MTATSLLILGASTRAAAFSALRAGLSPWCIDLFGDRDLQVCAPGRRLQGRYPHAFLEEARAAPAGPWMYTGALEGWPRLVDELARQRPLWGCPAAALRRARSPSFVHQALRAAGLPCPEVARPRSALPGGCRWLVKPRRGAGGAGICFVDEAPSVPARKSSPAYLQEYIEGMAGAALYAGAGRGAHFLGLTRQLTGAAWLSAAPFRYCGSVGPLPLAGDLGGQLEQIGEVLARECGMRGLFGVDGILREGVFWPVEINPRYTASVEVLEYANGVRALAWHQAVCSGLSPATGGFHAPLAREDGTATAGCVGKAILFARERVVFPAEGPWLADLRETAPFEMPGHADIPAAGEIIEAGRPILTLLARGGSVESCEETLRERAEDLARRLHG